MNVLTFIQRTYHRRACSLYLLIASVCDFIHLNFGPLSNILQYGFHYDWAINSNTYCKLKSYIAFVFTVISATLTVIASIDRYILSSRNTIRWKFSTPSIALQCILFAIFFWFFFSTPIAFCYTRHNHSSHNEQLICSNVSQRVSCFLIQIIYTCIFNGFLPPLIMIYFGFLTCNNARDLRHRSLSDSARLQQINYQLTSMLILQTVKSSFASLPFAMFNCYLLATIKIEKSLLFQAKENLVNQIVYLLFWSNYTSFFVYMYSSDIFRHQCMKAIRRLVCCFYNGKRQHYYHRSDLKHLNTTENIFDTKYKPAQML
ncbi:unnamed protein product [Adineta steineri]|uniref:G-protein coupled receptors family 1 profile domain-containing protein n=1 Tax=Adineta steineri TaxID=433720 RepID=A0A814HWH1_9BILA|nr:unnamed protein product [Adineta steineri]CAF3841827.1 unnamed protein product [Adineta steineri]